jgi:ABC-2 type transport system permease protein
MTNIFTIFRKELNSYFNSPIAYLVLGFFGLLAGYFFYLYVAIFVDRSVQSQMMGGGRNMPMDVNDWVIRPLFSNLSVIGLFMIPMITMRLFAEEKRSAQSNCSPRRRSRDIDIIIGKWLSALALYACALGLSALSVATLYIYGKPDLAPILTGYSVSCCKAEHCWRSAPSSRRRTRNQIIAAFATFAVSLLLWVLDWMSAYETAAWAKVVGYMSVITHFESFAKASSILVTLFSTCR